MWHGAPSGPGGGDDYTVEPHFNLTAGVVGHTSGAKVATQAGCEAACTNAAWGCTQWSWSYGTGAGPAPPTPATPAPPVGAGAGWVTLTVENLTIPQVDYEPYVQCFPQTGGSLDSAHTPCVSAAP